jgi:hypothetical protein
MDTVVRNSSLESYFTHFENTLKMYKRFLTSELNGKASKISLATWSRGKWHYMMQRWWHKYEQHFIIWKFKIQCYISDMFFIKTLSFWSTQSLVMSCRLQFCNWDVLLQINQFHIVIIPLIGQTWCTGFQKSLEPMGIYLLLFIYHFKFGKIKIRQLITIPTDFQLFGHPAYICHHNKT